MLVRLVDVRQPADRVEPGIDLRAQVLTGPLEPLARASELLYRQRAVATAQDLGVGVGSRVGRHADEQDLDILRARVAERERRGWRRRDRLAGPKLDLGVVGVGRAALEYRDPAREHERDLLQ